MAVAWLACWEVPASARGLARTEADLVPCPYPGSGIVHLYGEIESVTVVRNPVKHEGKAFLTLPRNRDLWDEKHVLTLRIDSGRGREELDAPLVRYPVGYGSPVHGMPVAPDSADLVGRKGLFRFERSGGELILVRIWSWNRLTWNPKVCRERLPALDSLESE